MWQLAILAYYLFGSASYLLRRVLAQEIAKYNRLANAIFLLCFLFPVGLVLGFVFPHDLAIGWLNLALLLGGSVVWPLYYLAAFRANRDVDVGIFSIINNLSPIFTLALAFPLLHEHLTPRQLLGVALLISSGITAALAQTRGGRGSARGIAICILAAAIGGVAVVYERFMLTRVDFGTYLWLGWGAQIAWSVAFAGRDMRQLSKLLRSDNAMRRPLLWWGLTSVLRSVGFIAALKLTNASLVAAASDFMSVAVVIAAYFFLRERDHVLYKAVAAGIGVMGLLLIA